jgi:uncharacterized protein YbjQ (UPF0145 family)
VSEEIEAFCSGRSTKYEKERERARYESRALEEVAEKASIKHLKN